MKEIKNLKQKLPAIIIALALVATFFVPTLIAEGVPQKTTVVQENEKGKMDSLSLDITFDAPVGWDKLKQASSTFLAYKTNGGESEIDVEVISNSADFKVTLDRYVEIENRYDIALVLSGEKVEKNGFTGEYCYVIKPREQKFGKGAVLYKDKTFLSVISYGKDDEVENNLEKLLDSLEGKVK